MRWPELLARAERLLAGGAGGSSSLRGSPRRAARSRMSDRRARGGLGPGADGGARGRAARLVGPGRGRGHAGSAHRVAGAPARRPSAGDTWAPALDLIGAAPDRPGLRRRGQRSGDRRAADQHAAAAATLSAAYWVGNGPAGNAETEAINALVWTPSGSGCRFRPAAPARPPRAITAVRNPLAGRRRDRCRDHRRRQARDPRLVPGRPAAGADRD